MTTRSVRIKSGKTLKILQMITVGLYALVLKMKKPFLLSVLFNI